MLIGSHSQDGCITIKEHSLLHLVVDVRKHSPLRNWTRHNVYWSELASLHHSCILSSPARVVDCQDRLQHITVWFSVQTNPPTIHTLPITISLSSMELMRRSNFRSSQRIIVQPLILWSSHIIVDIPCLCTCMSKIFNWFKSMTQATINYWIMDTLLMHAVHC
jgi:hypothetical protein